MKSSTHGHLKSNFNVSSYDDDVLVRTHKCFPLPFPQKYEFTVEMTCGGCVGAVERVLGRLEGEISVNDYREEKTRN